MKSFAKIQGKFLAVYSATQGMVEMATAVADLAEAALLRLISEDVDGERWYVFDNGSMMWADDEIEACYRSAGCHMTAAGCFALAAGKAAATAALAESYDDGLPN